MRKIFDKKVIYLVFLFVIIFLFQEIKPTFAKFSNDYVTEDDVVGLHLNFDLGISDFSEYEEIKVEANSYEVFDVNVMNNTSDLLYYGVWYKMINPHEISHDILIGRLEDNFTSMSGEIDSLSDKTVSVIIKNNSANDIVVAIGVAGSDTGFDDIEYLGGKRLITGSYKEVDYIYDSSNKKYISNIDSNIYFFLNSVNFKYASELQKYTSNHLGVYKIEAWGASRGDDDKGSYVLGTLKLKENDNLFVSVGKKNSGDDSFTDIRLLDDENVNESVASRVLIAGSEKSSSYISGHLGSITPYFVDKELEESCKSGSISIECSYHFSDTIFRNTKIILGDSEMDSFDGKDKMVGNKDDGFVKITPVVPTIEIPSLKVKMGEDLDTSSVRCVNSLNGCHIIRVLPQDTKDLALGNYKAYFMVSDDDGIVYRYSGEFDVVE